MGMNMEFIKNDAYSGELDYRAFGSMLDHPTQCYKFYWLEAIMNLMLKKYRFSFDEIFDEMIVSAWYTVTQYHLFLGPMVAALVLIHCISSRIHIVNMLISPQTIPEPIHI